MHRLKFTTLNYFLTTEEDENYLEAEVHGERKISLVVPAKYKATTKDKRFANILREKLEEKKKICSNDTVHSEFKKFPNKKSKKNKHCHRKCYSFFSINIGFSNRFSP